MNITVTELAELIKAAGSNQPNQNTTPHPMFGERCLVRTYSAGVHVGTVAWINPNNSKEVKLTDALRIWSWSNGGLSLSDIASKGVVKARINRTGSVALSECIEMIPTTPESEATYVKFIE